MLASSPDWDRFRVLIGHRPPAPATRYVDQVVGDNQGDIDFQYFGGTLKRLDIDVVHLVNPAQVLGGMGTMPRHKSCGRRRSQALELVRTLDEHRIALVQTVFPAASGTWDTSTRDEGLEILNEWTAAFIALDELTATPDPARATVIPYAHYRDRFRGFPLAEQVPGRLLCVSRVGLARAAAGPLKVFSLIDTPGMSLRVVGDVDPGLGDLVPRAIRRSPDTVSALVEHISDAELVSEMSAAEVVILPSIDSLGDLTTLFMALSLDRPVVVPQSPTTSMIANDVGPGWVHCLPGAMTAERLDDTIRAVRTTPHAPRPNLDGRDADAVAAQYAAVFHSAAELVRFAGASVLAS